MPDMTRKQSDLEMLMEFHIAAAGLPKFEREYQFHPVRKWRCDFAWPGKKVILEIEGGVWNNGGHVRGKGYTDNCEKYNEAALMGFMVLRVTEKHVKNGQALQWLEVALSKKTC